MPKKTSVFLRLLMIVSVFIFSIDAYAEVVGDTIKFGDLQIPVNEEAGNVLVFGGNVNVAGKINGDAVVFGGNIQLFGNGTIRGDAVTIGGKTSYASRDQIGGDVVEGFFGPYGFKVLPLVAQVGAGLIFLKLIAGILSRIALICIAVLLSLIAVKPVEILGKTIQERPWKSGLIGMLVLSLLPAFVILLAITVVGILFIPALVVFYMVMVALGFAAVSATIGMKLKAKRASLTMQVFLGSIILIALSLIPFVGGIIIGVILFWGSGAVVLSRFGTTLPKAAKAKT